MPSVLWREYHKNNEVTHDSHLLALFQLDIAWQLFEYHCHNLGEEEAMWCKMPDGLQIRRTDEKCFACFKRKFLYATIEN